MTRTIKALALTLAAAAAFQATPAARAAVSYQYATDLTALTLAPGQLGTVNLYLVETTTSPSTSRLVAESGLSSAYVSVLRDLAASPSPNPALVTFAADNAAEFNDPFANEFPVAPDHNSAYIREFVDIAQPTGPTGTPSPTDPTVRQIFLGSVTLTGGATPGTTTFNVVDDPATNDTVTITGFASPLDPLITPTSFTVTTLVPEPASLLAACGLAFPLLRSRRHAR